MKEFEYQSPVKLVFGRGKTEKTGKIVAQYGKKAMIVTGRSSTKKSGLLDRVIELLKKENLEYFIFDKIEENPLTTVVKSGAITAREECCDVILGLGGGSALDAAKAIAFLSVNEGDVSEYIFGRQGIGALPIVCITTTAGTGSEADSTAVLTNPETKDKKALKSPFIYPKASIIDPELMKTLPKNLIAATGIDALSHCLEGYVANRGNFFTDLLSIKGIEMVSENLPKVYENPNDMDAWDQMAIANTIGGLVLDSAGVTLAHGLEHSVSGLLNVRHGEGLAAIILKFMEYTYSSLPDKFAKIASAMGEDVSGLTDVEAAKKSISRVEALMKKVGLDLNLSLLGVKPEHVDWLTANSQKTMTYAISNSPRVPGTEELKALYLKCL